MLLVILVANGFRAYNDFEGYHQEIGKNGVKGAVNNIELLIEGARNSLTLFARDNQKLLQQIHVKEDKSIVFDELVALLDDHFPSRQAFALADNNGFVIVDDKGEVFSRQCINDIKSFAKTNNPLNLDLHPDQSEGHIDLMVPWGMMNGQSGVFIMSYAPNLVVDALDSGQLLGHDILITRTEEPTLIEIISTKSNSGRRANQHLNDLERDRINFASAIPGTHWSVVDIFDKELLSLQRDNIFSQATFSFILFCILSVILLVNAKKEEWRRQLAEQNLKTSNEELEETIAHRTRALVELNNKLKKENSERKIAEEKLTHIARYDSLTELPNRLLLNERLQQAYLTAKRCGQRYALFFLDIDHFKHINDSFGHSFGDRLLVIIAQRLMLSIRKEDVIARFGGDEFAILINDVNSQSNLTNIAEKITNSIVQPITIDQQELYVTVSIGIAIYPDDGDTIETIMSNADAAMYRSKLDGRNSFAFFTDDMAEKLKRRHILSNSLQQALVRNEFSVVYQPKIDIYTNEMIGAEALLRWTHPTLGPIAPNEFIPILEEKGLITTIGNWTIEQVCLFIKNRMLEKLADIRIAINLSANQFRDPKLVSTVRTIIESHHISPSLVEFEVTESLLIQNIESTQSVLKQFHTMNINITIDDFGTGYASINYLRLFPVSSVKIDSTFLHSMVENEEDAAVVKAIITMAHSLDLTCIAEGVETNDQLKLLKSQKCNYAQGFLYSEPLKKEQFNLWQNRRLLEIVN